jgi:hypothetical protein
LSPTLIDYANHVSRIASCCPLDYGIGYFLLASVPDLPVGQQILHSEHHSDKGPAQERYRISQYVVDGDG